ncbi:MAG: ribbon-helix-helix protein, CopG family [Candidatus Methylomirabilia bacterium]
MARINVFLKDDQLKALDSEAGRAGMSRSAFLQAALLKYLDIRRREREEAEAQRRMDEACKRMDELAEKLGDWDPVRIIREFRDSRYGGKPLRKWPSGARKRP